MIEGSARNTKVECGEKHSFKRRGVRFGFTIVELVVVVAVISILSAIVIPTFIELINKTKLKANKSFVKSLNEVLAVKTTGNNKNLLVETAVKYISESEIDENKLVEDEEDLDILYDENQGQFVLLEKSRNTNKSYFTGTNFSNYSNASERDFWKFYNKNSLKNGERYAIFIVGNDKIAEIEVYRTDFNAGTNSNISRVSYFGDTQNTGEEIIKITTNGGTLFVDGENDAIEHYGIAENIEIKAVAQNSYYENGEANIITISKGHLVLNKNSNVDTVFLSQKDAVDDSKFEEIKITIKDSDNIPEFKCDEITISGEEIRVATFVDGETESEYDLIIYQNGTTSLEQKDEVDENPNKIIASIKSDIDKIEIVKNGDSEDPNPISDDDQTDYSEYVKYNIKDINEWESFLLECRDNVMVEKIYLSISNDIDFNNFNSKLFKRCTINILDLYLNGNSKVLKNITSSIFGKDTSFAGNIIIKDLVIENASLEDEPVFISNANACDVEFKNVEIRNSSFTDTSTFINNVNLNATATFTNCKIVGCNIVAKEVLCAGFVSNLNDGELNFNNCEITSTNFVAEGTGKVVSGFVGEAIDSNKITKTNCKIDNSSVPTKA